MGAGKYEVLSQTLEILFAPGTALFRVPFFQRLYSWGPEEVGQLVDDIFAPIEKEDLPYFLGSIVLARSGDGNSDEGDLVLDGQQRLTTLSLLLSVLIEKVKEAGVDGIEDFTGHLFSRKLRAQRTPKVILQRKDAPIFERLLQTPSECYSQDIKNSQLALSVQTIYKQIEHHSINNTIFNKAEIPYEEMLIRLLYDVEIVKITAPNERDAFRLFETLNDRGLALSAADLIKNKLLSRCSSDTEDVIDSWGKIFESTKDDDIVGFLRTYWMANNSFARKNELYDKYKAHVEKLNPTEAALFVFELEEGSKIYQEFSSPNSSTCKFGKEIGEIFERLQMFNARSCRSALLAAAKINPDKLQKIAELCESITVRYSIVGEKNPSKLEKLYDEICVKLRNSGFSIQDLSNIELLNEVPSDEEFILKLSNSFKNSISSSWKILLERYNNKISNNEIKVNRTEVNVEHILPQNPSAAALNESGLTPEKAAKLFGLIGNLTLLSQKLNKQVSNRPFSEKKAKFSESDFKMTRNLVNLESWDEATILKRSEEISRILASIYLHPFELLVVHQLCIDG